MPSCAPITTLLAALPQGAAWTIAAWAGAAIAAGVLVAAWQSRRKAQELHREARLMRSAVTASEADTRKSRTYLSIAEQFFSRLQAQSPLAVLVTEKGKGYVSVNEAAAKLLGYTREQLLTMKPTQIVDPAELPRVVADRERIDSGEWVTANYRMRRADGSYVVTEFTSAALPNGRYVGIATDATERLRAQSEMHTRERERTFVTSVLESVGCLVVVLDLQGRIVRFNRACVNLSGCAPDEVLGQAFWEVAAVADDQATLRTAIDRVLAKGENGTFEAVWETRDGRRRTIEWSASVLTPDSGGQGFVIVTGLDATQRRRMEQELIQAQRMEAVGLLAGGIAHDFNNLLTAIFGHSGLARRSLPAGHAANDSIERIEQAATQAGRIVKSLLTFSRRDQAEKRPEQVAALLQDSLRLVQGTLPSSIGLASQLCDPAVYIHCDRLQIEQIILNLVFNARDAMPAGGSVRLSAAEAPAPEGVRSVTGRCVRISVGDTGEGMTRQVLSRAFEPFFTTKPRGKGTGLGLPIVRSIAIDHGGTAEIMSEPGVGTTVTITIPTCPAPEIQAPAPAAKGERIVLCVPRPYARTVISTSLRAGGFRVHEASDLAALRASIASRDFVASLIVLAPEGPIDLASLRALAGATPILLVVSRDLPEPEPVEHLAILREPVAMPDLLRQAHELIVSVPAVKG